MSTPLLELKDVQANYGKIAALKSICLQVYPGEIVTVIGANGAGKTTTLNVIAGVMAPSGGKIIFEGQDISGMPSHMLTSKGLALVPEGRKIFPRLTVMENLELGAYSQQHLNDAKQRFKQDLEHAFHLFPVLQERLTQSGGTLSGGEQQMLAIARALMSRPKMLLMDEPSMGVAPILVGKIFERILELNRSGMTILLVEQNAHLALKLAKRGYVLENGQIVLHDQASNLLTRPEVQQAYLGG